MILTSCCFKKFGSLTRFSNRRLKCIQKKNLYGRSEWTIEVVEQWCGSKQLTIKFIKKYRVNKDFNIYRMLIGRDKIIWLASVYLSKGTTNQLKLLFKKIYEQIPANEWKYLLLAGDYNFNLQKPEDKKIKLLNSLSKQFGLKVVRANAKTRTTGEPDFLLCGTAIKAKMLSLNKTLSDHKMLIWEVELPCPLLKATDLLPNRKLAEEITMKAWNEARNAKEFLKSINQ